MRKIVTTTFVTLDGVMQAPGGPGEDEAGGFQWGGWSVNYWDDRMGPIMDDIMATNPDLLLGRKTYQIFAAYWPNAEDVPGADKLNNAKKYVVSRTLDKVEWNNSTLIKDDAVQAITRLKGADGPELQVHGSSNLIQTLLKHNLIDELHVWIFPVTLGSGKRLFGDGAIPASFKLLDSKTSSTGVIIATYGQSGELKAGTFAS
ncbi:MAG: dihydrofolate reductase family protein [Anaerolineaceae bacterium]|nr:dihydrofolate reductase family protein [Anaerolineaceae bacterium]MDD5371499.1 dihydrofolate reductase family protein [Anaerolineaceae bacterium]